MGESTVTIKGFYPGSFPEGFCGYYAEEQDGTLYVGFPFSAVFGFFETGDFDVTIPVKGEIQQVVLKTKRMETSIWTADTGEAAATERSDVYARLEPSSPEPETPEQPAAPARELSSPMLLGGSEQTVYLDVSDEEILLWDNASGGQLIAVAKYAQAMQGAQDALQSCDFTDLDGDGSSELTAIFRFPDGTNASLVWFYTDGGFVYNPEFSILPGEPSAAGESSEHTLDEAAALRLQWRKTKKGETPCRRN